MSKPLKIGILSTASISEQIIRAAGTCPAVEIGAVASRDADKARAWADAHGIGQSFGDYEALLSSGTVEAVYIPLPNSLHAEWSIRALAAGLPVLCEKPLCTSAEDASRVAAASEKHGLAVMEGFMYIHHPMYRELFSRIAAGVIGKLSTINSRFTWMCDDRSEIPASSELAGGALFDVGCYCVHISRRLAVEEPLRVSAFERRSTVDDTLIGLLDFPNGILAQFETSIANYERHGLEIAGTEGVIIVERPWVPGEKSCSFTIHRENADPERVEIPAVDAYQLELEAFAELVRSGENGADLLNDSIANLAVIDALFASAKEGRAVDISS